MNGQVSMRYVCVCVCGEHCWSSGLGHQSTTLVVARSEPHQCRYLFHHTTHPAVKWVPSLFKARVDKTTDCGDHNILYSSGAGGTLGAHTPLLTGVVSAPMSTLPAFSLCWP